MIIRHYEAFMVSEFLVWLWQFFLGYVSVGILKLFPYRILNLPPQLCTAEAGHPMKFRCARSGRSRIQSVPSLVGG
jgi:hypothetical protein